jgi:hypothetical protein
MGTGLAPVKPETLIGGLPASVARQPLGLIAGMMLLAKVAELGRSKT